MPCLCLQRIHRESLHPKLTRTAGTPLSTGCCPIYWPKYPGTPDTWMPFARYSSFHPSISIHTPVTGTVPPR